MTFRNEVEFRRARFTKWRSSVNFAKFIAGILSIRGIIALASGRWAVYLVSRDPLLYGPSGSLQIRRRGLIGVGVRNFLHLPRRLFLWS